MVLLFYFDFNRRLKTFSEIANYSKLIGSPDRIKFYQDELQVLKMGYPVLGFFPLVLGISLELTPDTINKGLKIPNIFFKESFQVESHDDSDVFVTALLLGLSKANNTTEK